MTAASQLSDHDRSRPAPMRPAKATRRELWAWACYDWANSAYSALSITILVYYIKAYVLPGKAGDIAWGFGIGGSMLVAALVSPVLGALADANASKRRWLAVTALGGALASLLLGVIPTTQAGVIVALFIAAQLAFELSFGFYNGFLPELADEQEFNRVSAWGFAAGYVGGGLALAAALAVIALGPQIGLTDKSTQMRVSLVIMGLWWGLFTLPTLLFLRDRSPRRTSAMPLHRAALVAFKEVLHTLRNVRQYTTLTIFLAGFLLYNEGVNTVISQSSLFAMDELKMNAEELILVILMIQFAAFPGALLIGWLADRWGQKPTLMLCLACWTAILIAAYFVTTKGQFWGLAVVLALILGGTQSVSRAIMGVMTPASHTAEFMGFFSLSQKATSMVGPVLFVTIKTNYGSARLAILCLLPFILIGWAIASRIDVQRGRAEALRG